MPTVARSQPIRYLASTTNLLYGVRLSPSPWVTAADGQLTGDAIMEIVATNTAKAAIDVTAIEFSFAVGAAPALAQNATGIGATVTDTDGDDAFTVSTGGTTSATARFTVKPATGDQVSLGSGESVILELTSILPLTTAGSAVVSIVEVTSLGTGDGSFEVTTFPAGFFFSGLTANVSSASALVPVAQVAAGTEVVLSWDSSVVTATGVSIVYATANGQATATTSTLGQWPSPPLTADTVFVVTATEEVDDVVFTDSASIAVAVASPALVAGSLAVADGATTTTISPGQVVVGDGSQSTTLAPAGLTAPTLTVDAVAAAGQVVVGASGGATVALTPGAVTVADTQGDQVAVAPTGIAVTGGGGTTTITSTQVTSQTVELSSGAGTLTLSPGQLASSGPLTVPLLAGAPGLQFMTITGLQGYPLTIDAPTDGFAMAYLQPATPVDDESAGTLLITTQWGGTFEAFGGNISPTDTRSNFPMPAWLCVPVRLGDEVTFNYRHAGGNFPTFWFYFAGLGTVRPGAAAAELPPPPIAVPPEVVAAHTAAARRPPIDARAAALIDLLAPRLAQPLDAAERQALIDAIAALAS
jgi:hypothetical protein